MLVYGNKERKNMIIPLEGDGDLDRRVLQTGQGLWSIPRALGTSAEAECCFAGRALVMREV